MPRFALLAIPFLLVLGAAPALRAEDPPEETPEQKAARLAAVAGTVQQYLASTVSDDVVVRGNALEAILDTKELEELEVEGLVDRVRTSGLSSPDRFLAVLAGGILARVDAEGTVAWIEKSAFSGGASARRSRNALAMLSEIRVEKSARIAATQAMGGSVGTRVEALIALGKLADPRTLPAALAALGAQEKAVKDNAALALGKIGDSRAIVPLLGSLENADGDHPAFAAWALRQFDDPKIFAVVAERLNSDSGEPGDAKARVIESCSRTEAVPALRGILRTSRSQKYRYAAAVALGRLAEGDVESQKLLLTGLLRERDERIRAACYFGLSRNASAEIGPELVDGLKRSQRPRRDDQHATFRALAFLAGDLKLAGAAPYLARAAKTQENELTFRIAAVNFWRCADPAAKRKLREEFAAAEKEEIVGRMAEIFGRSKREQEFLFLCNQLRRFPKRSPSGLAVEIALETMTGHFFGPEYGTWRLWYNKNPDFFKPREYRLDRRKWREEFDQKEREFRQTPETERAVQLGLAWLSRHQSFQGSIDPNRFFERCSHKPGCKKTGSRHMLDPLGTTALAALTFLGGGYSPDEGKYKDTLGRLLDYIEVRQTADGNYTTTDRFQGYNRPIAVYALAEAYNITADERFKPYLRRGIDYLTEIQNENGGWRYQSGDRDTDTSVMSWVLLGLGSAHKSGFPVRESVFEGCDLILDRYSDRVTDEREDFVDIDPKYGYEVGTKFRGEYQTGYQSGVEENATVAFGLMSRMMLGWQRSHPFCIGSARFILNHKQESVPKGDRWEKYVSKNRFPSYAWYYGTLAMHQMGGRYFREWNGVIKRLIPGIQNKEGCDAGSFKVYNYDFVAGKVYSTCMGVLTLETYYRYKPFCEEGVVEEDEEEKPLAPGPRGGK